MVVTGENNDNNYQQREDKIKKEVKGEELVEQNS